MSPSKGASEVARAAQRKGAKILKNCERRGASSPTEKGMRDFICLEQSHVEGVISFQTYRPKVMSFGSSVGRMDGFGTSIGKIDGFGHQPESDGYGSSAEKVIVTGYQPKG